MTASRPIVLVLILGLFAWLFAGVLFGSGMFVYRDAEHYYYPLFQYVRSEWLSGRVPLWNPYENLGVPLAANPTASVFYPASVILLLPVGYSWAYKLYILAHVLWAVWAAYRLARHWQASHEAAGAAAITYAFGGSVLFQYANVVFLVGAAWLPLAVLAADRMLVERRMGWTVGLGAILAMMTLGGDPQTAYHAVLLAAMYAGWLWWSEPPRSVSLWERAGGRGWRVCVRSRLVLLVLAAGAGMVLAAVQVVPSIEFGRLSGRAVSAVPRTIYEVPSHLLSDKPFSRPEGHWTDGLTCRRLEGGSHHEDVYQFSVGPWRLAEYVWPNVGGRQFPVHRRWFDAIPAEGRVWVPSLYLGLLPLVLGVAAVRLSRADARTRWLSWMAILGLVGSLGWYGPGWLVREIRVWCGADPAGTVPVGAPFGGLYWLMTVLLPGYIAFRYPAKLLVPSALGLSMLAATGWDRAFRGEARRVRGGLVALSVASVFGLVVSLAAGPWWRQWLAGARPNPLFGPLDVTGAAADLNAALLQTAVLALAFWWLLGRASGGARWAPIAALLLVALDLGYANRWMIACAAGDPLRATSKVAAAIRGHECSDGDGPPCRLYRKPFWLPAAWAKQSSPTRLVESARWNRDTLFAYHNLAERIAVVEVYGTMMPYDYEVFLEAMKASTGENALGGVAWPERGRLRNVPETPPKAFPTVGISYAILPGEERWPEAVRMAAEGLDGLEDMSLWCAPGRAPRAWIVHRVDVLPPVDSHDIDEIRRRTWRVFFWEHGPRNLRESALVEVEKPGLGPIGMGRLPEVVDGCVASSIPSQATHGRRPLTPVLPQKEREEICRVVRYEPARVEVVANLSRPGLVVLCDQFYPGWTLEVATAGRGCRTVPVLRVNRVMRGAWLPAGQHRLTFRYQATGVFWGATVSLAGWLALAAGGILWVRQRHRRRVGT